MAFALGRKSSISLTLLVKSYPFVATRFGSTLAPLGMGVGPHGGAGNLRRRSQSCQRQETARRHS